jgi:tRNA modification GTPase
MLDRLDDTIVAISSAPGYGLVGIVRLSGPKAISIVDRMAATATNEPLGGRPTWTRVAGEVFIDGERSLAAMFSVFRAPHSYTRQDIVEIQTVGSPPVLELVRRRAIELGAVPAQPGEFTARAFLSGAMDLPSAEAVAGVIRAQTDTQLRASRRMMDGTLAGQITAARDRLAELLALVEAGIDFAEEPIEFVTPTVLRERLGEIAASLQDLLAGSGRAERFEVLPNILLFGPPNSGKSSLMNRLSGTSRAICAAAAGTTRDILSAPIRLRRGEAILLDSAGIDKSEDEIVAEACARTMSAAGQVDLVCVVVDLTLPEDVQIFETVRFPDAGALVLAANKADLVSVDEAARRVRELEGHRLGPVCVVSALTGAGIEPLRDAFMDALGAAATTTFSESVLLSERQRNAIGEAGEATQRAVSLAQSARQTTDCAELLAFELREALDALGTVTGQVTTEDLLNQIFANFCIGK